MLSLLPFAFLSFFAPTMTFEQAADACLIEKSRYHQIYPSKRSFCYPDSYCKVQLVVIWTEGNDYPKLEDFSRTSDRSVVKSWKHTSC